MGDKKQNNTVYYVSLALSLAVTVWAVAFNESFTVVANAIFGFFTHDFAWLYLLAMTFFVGFSIFIACSKWGKIRLGSDDAKPEYSTVSWFAMLFGAGMGVGLVFWGIAEPVSHYINPMSGIEGGTAEAADFAMRAVFMHWGVHPWSGYAVIGLALAYFQFRKNRPGLMSTILEPLIGEKGSKGWLGKLFDILAVFATVAGVVTSLGLGVLQINSGLNYLFGIPTTIVIQIIIILVISVIFIGTAVSGIDKGIKMISDANLYIAFFIMIACFLIGPKLEIVNNLLNGVGQYIGNFVQDSFGITAYGDNSWMEGWRVFYWAWWIAWAPFVGMFIARISKGRTIREFVAGVVLAPTLASIIWFAIFGTLGTNLGIKEILSMDVLSQVASTPETGVFVVMTEYPLGKILAVITLVLLCTFFITSANSGTYVLSQLTENGSLNPGKSKMLVWGIIMTVLSIGLLMAGGLKPLQTISIAAAFPFIFIMIVTTVSLVKALKQEKL